MNDGKSLYKIYYQLRGEKGEYKAKTRAHNANEARQKYLDHQIHAVINKMELYHPEKNEYFTI